jgi:hypothetical protein
LRYSDQLAARLRDRIAISEWVTVASLAWSFLAMLCISLIAVAGDVIPAHQIRFDADNLPFAALSVLALGCFVILFASARFSIGFVASFYLFAVTGGYLWLSFFTPLHYDHTTARVSVVMSFAAFALPALFITEPLSTATFLTHRQMDLVSLALVFICAFVAVYASQFNFHLVALIDADPLRNTLTFSSWVNYAINISVGTLLPFCYAWFVSRRRYAVASIAIAILLAFYPIMLNKTALLAPFWLIALTVLLKLVSVRSAVILSLLLPLILGLAAKVIDPHPPELLFRLINFRMLAIPASGIDHYLHFFSTHPLTHFCQISIIGKIFGCSLPDQLGIVMAKEYALGNYNASLLATEGIASVGVYLAPLSTLLCGFVVALCNMASARLEPAFVFLSGSILAQVLTNAPLSTMLLTHGGFLMFVLWFIAPRPKSTEQSAAMDRDAIDGSYKPRKKGG